jgi:hypothetical protein
MTTGRKPGRSVYFCASPFFWDPRIALSLACPRMTQARYGEATQILAPVHGRFTGGYETTDLRAARSLPDSLPKSRVAARVVQEPVTSIDPKEPSHVSPATKKNLP